MPKSQNKGKKTSDSSQGKRKSSSFVLSDTKRGKPITSKKRVRSNSTSQKESTIRTQHVEHKYLPDWLHWLITLGIMAVLSVGAYWFLLRPYFYRLRPCQGAKEYDVCLPTNYLYYGIDISHHQGDINWDKVSQTSLLSDYPIKFVIMKATEGSTFTDPAYQDNISNAHRVGFVCGVYHFYDPWTSPEKQAAHYINTVKLAVGDLVPVIDVEQTGRSSANLRHDLMVFIKAIEEHYGVKPIIYTSVKFRHNYLNDTIFDDYPFWVAHYYAVRPHTDKEWVLWQFTDRAHVQGIGGHTDLNVFKGTPSSFNSLRIK